MRHVTCLLCIVPHSYPCGPIGQSLHLIRRDGLPSQADRRTWHGTRFGSLTLSISQGKRAVFRHGRRILCGFEVSLACIQPTLNIESSKGSSAVSNQRDPPSHHCAPPMCPSPSPSAQSIFFRFTDDSQAACHTAYPWGRPSRGIPTYTVHYVDIFYHVIHGTWLIWIVTCSLWHSRMVLQSPKSQDTRTGVRGRY